MSRNLTASDRSALLKLASTMPVGSPERKAILAGLSKTGTKRSGWDYSDAEWAKLAMDSAKSLGATTVKEYLLKAKRAKGSQPSDGSSGQYDHWIQVLSEVLREIGFPEEDTSGSFVKDNAAQFQSVQNHLNNALFDLSRVLSKAQFERAMWDKKRSKGLDKGVLMLRQDLSVVMSAYKAWLEDNT